MLISWRFCKNTIYLQQNNIKVKSKEGRYGDGVGVIPIDVGKKVRLYCLRLSDKILVFGNGGVKDAATWEESEELASYVKLLIDTSRFIASRISDGSIVLVDKEIVGNLKFTRYEKE